MQINVSQLLKASIGTTRDYKMSEIIDIAGDGNNHSIQGEVSLLRTHRGILARCKAKTETSLTCSRCLSSFSFPLSLDIEDEYIPVIDIVSGAPLPPPEEPDTFTIDENHILDLSEAIRQYALLNTPMKPLCHKNCAGLCPDCGHNLNLGPCNCRTPKADPRWSELTRLLKK